ncbi:hypothetical protein TRAPUB_10065 [Trametes pubescens]|uniref:Uncharacterized protein n=1 Tax=Trametes pubescens TaxID=154538 RepID=A0A1M2W0A2_TRAPU|nr:hypothetical protein TRAPUB_10065 [Trametes pubescens]
MNLNLPLYEPQSLTNSYTSECTSLLSRKILYGDMRRGVRLLLWGTGTIALVLLICQNAGLVRCPLNDNVSAADKTALRQQWKEEWQKHQTELETWKREHAEYEKEAAGWERGREEHKKELEDWQRQREEEARHRLELQRRSQGVYWTEPHGDPHCRAYGTRAYYAYLKDVPGDLSWREVCYNMPPVPISGGRNLTEPDTCERNDKGDIVGTWHVSSGEPNCMTGWGWFEDKGCTPSVHGLLRFESSLENVREGDDQQKMCETTPAIAQ